MPGFLTDAQLQDAVLDQLQKTSEDGSATLAPWWPGLVTRANLWAYWEIVGRLAERGYTRAQIDAWDRGREFQQDLGVWRCIAQAALMQPDAYSTKCLELLDRRKELVGQSGNDGCPPVAVTTAGAFVSPAGTAGQVTVQAESTASDLFVPIDPDDVRIGTVTET